jgi:DNA helicase-2/ATP-dependent DNA helicase PcrA
VTIDLSTLNEPQREAVLHERGPLVVFAGAGSGKTRVIVHRVAHLVEEHRVPAWRICAVTFTNKAAQEMRERLEHLVPGAGKELVVGTFHATCARWLRRYAKRIGLSPDFTIYDDSDQKAMIQRVLKALSIDDKKIGPRTISSNLDRAKNELLDLETMDLPPGPDAPFIRAAMLEYEKRMNAASALDFGDLIARMVRALEADDGLRLELAGRYVHLLVDEFQDTNHAQLRLVRALSSVHRNVCVVGDDDQSIYRWRGADRRNILDFRVHFPETQVIKLEQNYRSTKRILRVSHAVISRNRDREPKELWTDNDAGAPISAIQVEDERAEAQLVVEAARNCRIDFGTYASLAVFYRVHAQSRVVEEALRGAKIPYRVVGGVRFYDRAEVKDLLAYLRVLANPEDDVSVLRIANVPTRGIGKTTLDRLMESAAARGVGVFAAMRELAVQKAAGPVASFVTLIDALREVRDLPIGELADRVLEASGYRKVLENEDTAETDARLENLAELVGAMHAFEEEGEAEEETSGAAEAGPDEGPDERSTLTRFLESVTLQPDQTDGSVDKTDVVTLMTVHAAKGLEFPRVVVVGMEEGLFPLRGQDPLIEPEELEEERRLAYVAFTRARQELSVVWASTRYVFGNMRFGTRSRFVDDFPPEDVRFAGLRGTAVRPAYTPPYRGSFDAPSRTSGPPHRTGRGESSGVSGRSPSSSPSSAPYVPGPSLTGSRAAPSLVNGAGKNISSETWLDRSEGNDTGLRAGSRVRHATFGEGRVVKLDDQGSMPKATVRFPDGDRTVALRFLELA